MAEERFDDDEPISLNSGTDDEEPLSLVDDSEEADDPGPSKVRAFQAKQVVEQKQEFQRELNVNGAGATRCRVFHSKIAEAPLEFMQNQINEWIDREGLEVKHVGHVIGTMEGKNPVPNVVVMVWY